jgi:sugar phosphate isomerase/epimerase
MEKLKFSYFQLTFGQEETYIHPERTYQRLKKFGYDAIELCPPKGRYGLGVSMEDYLATHLKLKDEYGLDVSCLNECWGEMWDPYSPNYKTLTEKKTADLAVSETKITIDLASELKAPYVTVAVAIHDSITADNVAECSGIAVEALRQMSHYGKEKGVSLVFEATNHLEMGKFVNTVANHKLIIEKTGADNIGIQIDWFHANFEELNPYEAVMDAGNLLWHMHFRDSNSLTPGYGSVDFKAVIRAIKKMNYKGYCTIESAPMVPDADTAAKDGIEYLKFLERIAEYQISPEFPNGYAIPQ